MKCVICHGNEVKTIKVKEEVTIENDIVYVPIKIPVCKNCGERYYDRKTLRFLEGVEKELHEKLGELKEIGKVLIYS